MFLEFYGLKEQPFGVTPDPRFLCASKTHSKAYNSLCRGLEAGCGFLALIAQPGMGKTALMFRLLKQLQQSQTSRPIFLFHTQCDSREFLRYLLRYLGVDVAGLEVVGMYERLNQFLAQELRARRRLVVIIDECQNLDDSVLETIRLLSNFETLKTKLMQIVLVGQTQLAEKMSSPGLVQLRQRISVLCRLDPLSREEVVKYIEHRLQVAGHAGPPPFTSEALEKIISHSEGIPRNVNNLCFNALLAGYEAGHKQIDSAVAEQVIADLEMNPREPHGAVTEREPRPSTSRRTIHPGFALSGIDPGRPRARGKNYSTGQGKIASEFDPTRPGRTPQFPQAQAPPNSQQAPASSIDPAPNDVALGKGDLASSREGLPGLHVDRTAPKPDLTRPNERLEEAPDDRGFALGEFLQPNHGASRSRLGRRVWGISTLAAGLVATALFLFHFGIRASQRRRSPHDAVAAPNAALRAPRVSSEPLAVRTSTTHDLASDSPPNQALPMHTTTTRTKDIVKDLDDSGHDRATIESPRRGADSDEGSAEAEFALGVEYALGNAVARDDKEAFRLFSKAAEQGNVPAQSALATSYWLGRGVKKNDVAAYLWATIAYERGDPPSGQLLKVLTGTMSPTELSEGARKAQEWQRKHSAD